MATTLDDDFDMPELTDEMLMEFKPLTELTHTDLHMGAAVVKPFRQPKKQSVDLFGIMADAVIGAGYLGAAWLLVQAWAWVLLS
jgi:hypothetical protein